MKVSDNFTFLEYFYPTAIEYDIPEALIKGVQYFRDFFGYPMRITSSYRPNDIFGQHRFGKAVDLVPVNPANFKTFFDTWEKECVNYKDSGLIQGMRSRGVNGFGVENNNCVHVDVRDDDKCTLTDKYGKFCIFRWIATPPPYGTSTLIT